MEEISVDFTGKTGAGIATKAESAKEAGIKRAKLIGLILGAIATVLFTAGMTRGVGAVENAETSGAFSGATHFAKSSVVEQFAAKDTINKSEICKDTKMKTEQRDLWEAAGCETDDGDVTKRAANIIQIFIGVMGVIAVIMIIYGGVSMVISLGNAEKVRKAKNIIVYSAIGLLVVLISFAIVNFVLDNVL